MKSQHEFDKRTTELKEMSIMPTFVDSESSEDDTCTEIQTKMIQSLHDRRSGFDNRICKYRPELLTPCSDSITVNAITNLHSKGQLAVRASWIASSRKKLRAHTEITEIFPKWFCATTYLQTKLDIENIIQYLKHHHGGTWKSTCDHYVAKHPFLNKCANPMLQNIKSLDFMYVSIYVALLQNQTDDEIKMHFLEKITPKVRTSVDLTPVIKCKK